MTILAAIHTLCSIPETHRYAYRFHILDQINIIYQGIFHIAIKLWTGMYHDVSLTTGLLSPTPSVYLRVAILGVN